MKPSKKAESSANASTGKYMGHILIDLTIVSRDTGDFEKDRVRVFNPWAEAAPPGTE